MSLKNLSLIEVNGVKFKKCKFRHQIAHDMFGSTVLEKEGWTDKFHEHLIEGDNFDKVITRKEYDDYEVYEEEW